MQRREMIRGVTGALIAGGVPFAARSRSPEGGLIAVNGTRLWVSDIGPRSAPAILYVHGGPGIGALDFEHYMTGPIAGRLRLICVDQRGVLRSDPLPVESRVTVEDLIADFETLRITLGVERWQVLGHSFGGMVALRYALAHSGRVQRLVLECPAIDLASSFRWLCAGAAQLHNGRNNDAALRAGRLADQATPFDDRFIAEMGELLSLLGERRQDLYVSVPKNRNIFSRLAATAGLPDARWEQGAVPGKSLLAQPSTRQSMLSAVASWNGPLLLVRGEGDHVTSPAELVTVERAGGRIVTVPAAGHYVHVEQPKIMADLLTG